MISLLNLIITNANQKHLHLLNKVIVGEKNLYKMDIPRKDIPHKIHFFDFQSRVNSVKLKQSKNIS